MTFDQLSRKNWQVYFDINRVIVETFGAGGLPRAGRARAYASGGETGGLRPSGTSKYLVLQNKEMNMSLKSFAALLLGVSLLMPGFPAEGAEKAKSAAANLNGEARAALKNLYAKTPAAKELGGKAVAILVFPSVKKAGLVIGGQYGEGALIKRGKPVAYYSTGGVSYGLQAGAQTYGYALFFMDEKALQQLDKADGFELGVGPSLVVVDQGMAKSITTTTTQPDIYAFVFGQKGLMAGIGVQGNKITRIHPK